MTSAKDECELDFSIIGSTGLKQYGGEIDEEFHPKLKGKNAIKVYQQMSLNSASVGSFLYAIKSLIQQVTFRVVPSGNTSTHVKEAEFLEEILDDMSTTWQELTALRMTKLEYGFSYFEIVWKLRQGNNEESSTIFC